MNLRDLKYIVAVAECHHFGQAAERCFVSQPTLSSQIKKLEDSLGVSIFERTNRSVEVTPVGESILAKAREVLERTNAIEQLAHTYQDPLAGPLRIGAIPTLSPYLMPSLFKPLKKKHPQMKVVLTEELTKSLLERLQNHEIDAALIATEVDSHEYAVTPLFKEPFWLAHPSNHPITRKVKITRKDLDTSDLLLLSEGHCLAKQAMDVCRRDERTDRGDMADLRASSLETLLQMVSAGFGTTLVPALAMNGAWTKDKAIKSSRLELNDAFRNIILVYRKSYPRRQALDALVQVVSENLPDSVHPLTIIP
jgi:LysR family transcriptional regulator, hydrogen peroxide-inducible genes activator